MIVELGAGHRFDATHRALVVGIVHLAPAAAGAPAAAAPAEEVASTAAGVVDAGADALCLRPLPGAGVPERVADAVGAIRVRTSAPILVETSNPVVAAAAFGAGAVGVRDVSSFAHPDMLTTCARHDAAVIAVHTPLGPSGTPPEDVAADLAERARSARAAGVPASRVIVEGPLDVGITACSCDEPGRLVASIVGGARVVLAHDVRAARRTADVVAALVERRGEAAAA